GADYVKCLPIELVAKKLKPLLEDTSIKQVYHNWLFDYHVLKEWMGITTVPYFDTVIASALLDENIPKDLETLSAHYLKLHAYSFSKLFGKNYTFDRAPILINPKTRTGNIASYYAIRDTESTYKLYK